MARSCSPSCRAQRSPASAAANPGRRRAASWNRLTGWIEAARALVPERQLQRERRHGFAAGRVEAGEQRRPVGPQRERGLGEGPGGSGRLGGSRPARARGALPQPRPRRRRARAGRPAPSAASTEGRAPRVRRSSIAARRPAESPCASSRPQSRSNAASDSGAASTARRTAASSRAVSPARRQASAASERNAARSAPPPRSRRRARGPAPGSAGAPSLAAASRASRSARCGSSSSALSRCARATAASPARSQAVAASSRSAAVPVPGQARSPRARLGVGGGEAGAGESAARAQPKRRVERGREGGLQRQRERGRRPGRVVELAQGELAGLEEQLDAGARAAAAASALEGGAERRGVAARVGQLAQPGQRRGAARVDFQGRAPGGLGARRVRQLALGEARQLAEPLKPLPRLGAQRPFAALQVGCQALELAAPAQLAADELEGVAVQRVAGEHAVEELQRLAGAAELPGEDGGAAVEPGPLRIPTPAAGASRR